MYRRKMSNEFTVVIKSRVDFAILIALQLVFVFLIDLYVTNKGFGYPLTDIAFSFLFMLIIIGIMIMDGAILLSLLKLNSGGMKDE